MSPVNFSVKKETSCVRQLHFLKEKLGRLEGKDVILRIFNKVIKLYCEEKPYQTGELCKVNSSGIKKGLLWPGLGTG